MPVAVDLKGVIAIDAGCDHVLALKNNGTVWAWGRNLDGQLGDGSNNPSETPVKVKNLDNVKAISAGCVHSLALKKNGTVRGWGSNDDHILSDGTTNPHNEPVTVQGVDNVKAISAGNYMSAVLKRNGRVLTWGDGFSYQLGHGNTDDQLTPKVVEGLTDVKRIAVTEDGSHMLALKENGRVRAWGSDNSGQLGNGIGDTDSLVPAPVQNLDNVKAIAAGYAHSLAVLENGTVKGWGLNEDGQLGDGTFEAERHTPVRMRYISNGKGVAAGEYHSLVLLTNGTVGATGYNTYGQLGDNSVVNKPVAVPVLSNARQVSASVNHSHAVKG